MTKEELEKLMHSAMISLNDEEKDVFIEYFDGMKKMLDDFYHFEFPENFEDKKEEKNQTLFEGQSAFSWLDLVMTNVTPEKIQNHSIEIVSHFGN